MSGAPGGPAPVGGQAGGQKEGARGPGRPHDWKFAAQMIGLGAFLAYLIAFFFFNRTPVKVDFVFFTAKPRLIWALLVAAVLGAVILRLLVFRRRRRRATEKKKPPAR